MSVRGNFKGITDEQWRGDEPYCEGTEWISDGKKEKSERYVCSFGGGEVVFGKCVNAEIRLNTVRFSFYGLVNPWVRVILNETAVCMFDSRHDAPNGFDKFKLYLKDDIFKCRLGEKFINRLGECLNYTFSKDD